MAPGPGAGDPSALSAAKAALLRRWQEGGALRLEGGGPGGGQTIRPRVPASPVPLSLAQRRLWFLEQLAPGTPAYNLFFCARVGGHLDPGVLAASVEDLVDRHEALRTTIGRDQAGDPCQLVDAGARPALEVVDLRQLDPDAAEAAALQRMDKRIHQPFDLEAGPLGRVLLCRGPDLDVLGLVIHHLVGDGWSLGVALRDLAVLYQARTTGQALALEPLPVQPGDVAVWQQQRAEAERPAWEREIAWWRQRLEGAAPLELPTDHPRPAVISASGDWRELRLDRELSDALRALARQEDATLFMVVLAALHLLLAKLSGQRDLIVGTAVASRTWPETLGLIGNFINMLALRTDATGAATFRALLGRVRETCLGAFAHQQVPFERLVEALQPERDLSRSVLFQALLVLQPPTAELRFAGLPLELIELGSRTVRADLEVHLWDHPALVGRVAFSTDLFEPATVERLAERLERLLRAVAADPDLELASWSPVLAEEQRLLDAWSRWPERPVPPADSAPELIAQQALRTPDAVAVTAGDEQLSYGDLDRRANQLAHHLRALGVGPEVRVGVCLERTTAILVAVLGVLKAGGVYVPLDPHYPAERLTFMVADAHAPVVVTERALAGLVASTAATLLRLDDRRDRDVIAACPPTPPPVHPHPDNLAYVIYTSGSTGQPKGVQITHRALANLIAAFRERPGLRQGDVVASVASLSFDASVAELFPALATGATVVVAATDDVTDGRLLLRLLRRHRVTFLQATATIWRLLLAVADSAEGGHDRPVTALCGGEATSPDLAEALAVSHQAAWNMYGPTEATVWATADRMAPGRPVSLGRPLANTRVHILDDDLLLAPIGVSGELCIGGTGLSRGYLDRPALTAERFVPDPFAPSGMPGARLYRTGDLARWRADGALEFLGRRDDQVKLRGHRIELGEIEATLSAHPAVEQAVVVVRQTGADPDTARLVAYVVLAKTAPEETRDASPAAVLLAHLRERLPEHMVPSSLLFLNDLPTTPTGKVDRRRLPPAERTRPELGAAYVPPRTALEEEIAGLVAAFLELERVGVEDDFFDLGGHSLLAAKLITELQRRYGVELALQELFVAPTVSHLAAQIGEELAREQRLRDQDQALRRGVDELPEAAVDSLLAELLANKPR